MKTKKITGKTVAEFVKWLKEEDSGCCHFNVFNTEKYLMHICVGWHDTGDGWKIYWKIGMETYQNAMQCDFDVDFIMPYDEEGNVYDTCTEIVEDEIDWDVLAEEMNTTAEAVVKYQLELEGETEEEAA